MMNRPTINRQRLRSSITNAAFKKKNPKHRRWNEVPQTQPNPLRLPLRDRSSLWIAPELGGEASGRDGIWLAPGKTKA